MELHRVSRVDGEARANGGAVALRAPQVERNPMVAVGQMIAQQSGGFTDIQNQDIDCDIIPNICTRNPATRSQGQIRELGSGGSVFKCPVVLVKMEKEWLSVAYTFFDCVHLRIHMAV